MTNKNLNSNGWNLVIDLLGGRISKLKYNGERILGSYQRIDGKTGNTHLCIPNFANEGVEKYGLMFHGPARNGEWKVLDQKDNEIKIYYQFENVGSYPGKIGITQKFTLGKSEFKHEIKMKNLGESAVPINLAIHNYWDSFYGWQGLKLNGLDVSKIVEVSDYVKLEEKNEIKMPSKNKIIWKLEGFNFAKLWTGFVKDNDCNKFDEKYVCVEPVMTKEGGLDSSEIILDKKSEIECKQKIRIKLSY
jgi:galactose mutarotase-like enzyme